MAEETDVYTGKLRIDSVASRAPMNAGTITSHLWASCEAWRFSTTVSQESLQVYEYYIEFINANTLMICFCGANSDSRTFDHNSGGYRTCMNTVSPELRHKPVKVYLEQREEVAEID